MKVLKSVVLVVLFCFFCPFQSLTQWMIQNSGTKQNLLSISFVDSLKGWVVGGSGIILHTKNGGLNWEKQHSSTTFNLNSVSFCDSLNGWTVGYGGMILRTTDSGENWVRILHDTDNITRNDKVKCLSPSEVLISRSQFYGDYYGGYTLWKSTDNGETWTVITPPKTLTIGDFDFTSIQKGWIVDVEEHNLTVRVQKTTDGGINWTYQILNPYYSPKTIYFENDSIGWTSDGYSLFKTSDSGVLWSKKSNVQLYDLKGFTMIGDVGYSLSYESLYKTTDSGYTWTKESLTSTNFFLDLEFVTKDIGWIVSTYGFIAGTRNGGVTSIMDNNSSLIIDFKLNQNYPNPFNPSTNITYEIPRESYVSLEIFDNLGRKVKTLVKEQQAMGRYSIKFNASNLSSGLFFYRLQSEKISITKKLLLLK